MLNCNIQCCTGHLPLCNPGCHQRRTNRARRCHRPCIRNRQNCTAHLLLASGPLYIRDDTHRWNYRRRRCTGLHLIDSPTSVLVGRCRTCMRPRWCIHRCRHRMSCTGKIPNSSGIHRSKHRSSCIRRRCTGRLQRNSPGRILQRMSQERRHHRPCIQIHRNCRPRLRAVPDSPDIRARCCRLNYRDLCCTGRPGPNSPLRCP